MPYSSARMRYIPSRLDAGFENMEHGWVLIAACGRSPPVRLREIYETLLGHVHPESHPENPASTAGLIDNGKDVLSASVIHAACRKHSTAAFMSQ